MGVPNIRNGKSHSIGNVNYIHTRIKSKYIGDFLPTDYSVPRALEKRLFGRHGLFSGTARNSATNGAGSTARNGVGASRPTICGVLLQKSRFVCPEQIRTINRETLLGTRPLGTLEKDEMAEVYTAVKQQLGLPS